MHFIPLKKIIVKRYEIKTIFIYESFIFIFNEMHKKLFCLYNLTIVIGFLITKIIFDVIFYKIIKFILLTQNYDII